MFKSPQAHHTATALAASPLPGRSFFWGVTMRTVLVTGSTDGIGFATARILARRGARVLVHGRSQARLAETISGLQQAVPEGRFEAFEGDFASFASVRALAGAVRERAPDLDVLVNNAGVFASERQLTQDGHELTWQVNHLAPFLLTLELLPLLQQRPAARIVNVSSIAHTRGGLFLDDPSLGHHFDGYRAYAQSKLANVLFTQELARRLTGTPVTVTSLHPGVIQTKLLREGFGAMQGGSLDEGAATSVKLALDPLPPTANGGYFIDGYEREPATRDEVLAAKLFAWSEAAVAAS
ncbi:MAG: SDR family oxidoreductase [Myxococcota bacterium]